MQLTVKIDIEAALRKLGSAASEAPKAVTRALNKTATTARAEAARDIRDQGYGLKVGDIKDALTIRRATPTELKAVLQARGKPIPLIKYGARQTNKGVTVNVLRGRKLIKGAFIATMPSGHKGVFVRTGNQHKRVVRNGRVTRSGLPIKELFGPSRPAAFANEAVQTAIREAIVARFPIVLRQELKFAGVIS